MSRTVESVRSAVAWHKAELQRLDSDTSLSRRARKAARARHVDHIEMYQRWLSWRES